MLIPIFMRGGKRGGLLQTMWIHVPTAAIASAAIVCPTPLRLPYVVRHLGDPAFHHPEEDCVDNAAGKESWHS